jgi:hypothetical protein
MIKWFQAPMPKPKEARVLDLFDSYARILALRRLRDGAAVSRL